EGGDTRHGGHTGGAGTREGARTVGGYHHGSSTAGQVVERVENLHGHRWADGRAGGGGRRLLQQRQVIRRRRSDREAAGGGAGQACAGGTNGVTAGYVEVLVAKRRDARDGRHAGGAGTREGARAVGRYDDGGRAASQVVELVENLHGDSRA